MMKEEMVKHTNRSFISKKLSFCSHVDKFCNHTRIRLKKTTKKECKFLQLTFLKLQNSPINDIKSRLESIKIEKIRMTE